VPALPMPAEGHVGQGPAAGLAVVLSEGLLAEVMGERVHSERGRGLREHFADSEPPGG